MVLKYWRIINRMKGLTTTFIHLSETSNQLWREAVRPTPTMTPPGSPSKTFRSNQYFWNYNLFDKTEQVINKISHDFELLGSWHFPIFSLYITSPRSIFRLNCAEKSSDGVANINFPNSCAAARTHVTRVAPDRDLLKDALPTELPRCSWQFSNFEQA